MKITDNLEIDGNDILMLYVEGNGVEGYQVPEDWKNPKENEDKIISSKSVNIEVSKNSSINDFDLKEGINIIFFDFIPLASGGEKMTAKDLVEKYPNAIKYIAEYSNGKWGNIVGLSNNNESLGNNFEIIPGKGYLIYMSYDFKISISGLLVKSPIPVAFSQGWNLVGIHGYSKKYTARTLIDSINSIEGLKANNVSWWPTSKSKYEGLQVEDNQEYGLDFPISSTNGYFVRINEFKPESSDCKSIIWHDGGELNGSCGNSKTIF